MTPNTNVRLTHDHERLISLRFGEGARDDAALLTEVGGRLTTDPGKDGG